MPVSRSIAADLERKEPTTADVPALLILGAGVAGMAAAVEAGRLGLSFEVLFANKGLPMQDPECVRCSACVQSCPTGVLQFGEVARNGQLIGLDTLAASPVPMREGVS